MLRTIGEPDLGEQGERALAQLAAGDADRSERRLDVLQRGQRRDQVELLEDEAERAQPQLGELVVAQRREVAALEEDLAVARPVERAEQLQQRRLARAARAFERDELAGGRCAGRRRSTRAHRHGPFVKKREAARTS